MIGRAPKFLDALKVVSKLLASDQKIERSWMLPMLLNCMSQYHLKFLEYSIKKYDAISSKVTGVIDVTRARIPCQITTKCGDFRCTPQPPQSPHNMVIYTRKMDNFGFP